MAGSGRGATGRRGAGGDRESAEPANRELILDAAQRLFADAGYAATSTAKIAARAGVPHGLVFYYFPSKRDLLLAVVRERAYQRSLLRAGDVGQRDVGEVLRGAARELGEIFARNRDTQMILFREAGTDPEMQTLASELVASSTGDLAELLAGASDASADAEVRLAAARLLVSTLLMDNFLRSEAPDPARADDVVRLLADGVRRPATRKDR